MRAAQSESHEDGGQKWMRIRVARLDETRRDVVMRLIRFDRIGLVHADVSRLSAMPYP
jgi:hypothetical protein